MTHTPLEEFTDQVVETLKNAGGTVYQVGGSVRDQLLGLESKDVDLLVTEISGETVHSSLSNANWTVDLVGKSFGVFKVYLDPHTLDVALPRVERSTGSHHRDFEVHYSEDISLKTDLERRDFTVNTLALRLTGEYAPVLEDHFGGRADLESKILRAVGDPKARFEEDPLRMLRLARFMAKLDFTVEPHTAQAVRDNVDLIGTVSLERVFSELKGLLSSQYPSGVLRALRFLRDSGLLERIIPEFKATFGYDQKNPYHHLTLDEHLFEAVRYAVEHGFSLESRLALLFHDMGKPQTQSFDEKGVAHYYKHDLVGASTVGEILERLKASLEEQKCITKLVFQHMRPPLNGSSKVLRNYVHDLGQDWPIGLEVREADRAAHAGIEETALKESLERIRTQCLEVAVQVATFDERALAVSGSLLIERFGVQGPQIGLLKKAAAQAVVDGDLENEAGAILEWLEGNRAILLQKM
jgi:tRNA nucleotidyltransferase (CCA-adding enzyme)